MKYSALILSGGPSKRFGEDKGLVELVGRPLIRHVFDRISNLIDEVIVVLRNEHQLEKYGVIFGQSARLIFDESEFQAPLIGALTGFKAAKGRYSLLLPCDTPLISREAISLLLDLAPNHGAVIPRWPNGYIEPLHAVYQTKMALRSAQKAFEADEFNLRAMIAGLSGVLYLSTLVIKRVDPNLHSFFNVNSPAYFKRAEEILRIRS